MAAKDGAGKIAVVQMDCVLGEVAPNLEKIGRFARTAAELGAELAVFPECATTGYFVADKLAALAEPVDGPTAQALADIARESGLCLAVGVVTAEEGAHFDSQLLFSREGALLGAYRKVHLFSAEKDCYRPGHAPLVVETPLGRVGMTVCYDLIFAEYVRRLIELGADLVINSTNWITDSYHREVWGWSGPTTQSLAVTRALENVTVVAMANRVGHEMDFDSLGHSCIIAPSGKILASVPEGEGLAVADVRFAPEDIAKWRGLATYRQDRRPEVYG